MSQRAAWQLERLGFAEVYDFVLGKAHWLASGRPTARQEPIERVGDFLSETPTAHIGDIARDIAGRWPEDASVVVTDERGTVFGRAAGAQLQSAAETATVEDVMKLGPTTIRPDEPRDEVRKRMELRGVTSILVTRPTGVLLGQYVPKGDEP